MGWLRNRLNLVDAAARPTPHEEFEMSVRVEEALAATAAAAQITQAQAEEAQRLFGTIRREIQNAHVGEASSG